MNKYVKDYGVQKDSYELQTEKIQHAIDDCAEQGFELVFEKGVYRTGTLFLRNNSKIVLEENAVISGSDCIEDYPDNDASFVDAVEQRRGKTLILAHKAENVSVTGSGEICGNGGEFSEDTRPFLVRVVESNHVKIDGVRLTKAAAWCLHINNCTHVDIKNITIDSRVNDNNDGIDIDSSDNVNVENCHIMSGDDGICLKATSDRPCKNIFVKNCKVSSGWAGFKIGTESVGDFSHIRVSGCYFYDILGGGIKIVPTDGANVKDVKISDIQMENCTGPIFIALGERLRSYAGIGKDTLSTIENVCIENVTADAVSAPVRGTYLGQIWGNAKGGIIISGTKKNPIKNLSLRNIKASLPGGVTERIKDEVPYIGEKYPEFHMMDIVPAKGIYMRDVDGATLENIQLSFKEADNRDVQFFENVIYDC